jgi:Pyridine nucleotide-disulphide oxidoreductase
MGSPEIDIDVAIVGSGPYGLSAAAHLSRQGLRLRTFGPPMNTWRTSMPEGMLFKSDGFATSLSAPIDGWTLREYCERTGAPYLDPVLSRVVLEQFVEYGDAFQRELVPDLDPRLVTEISSVPAGFSLVLEDGETVTAARVVIAVGITHYDYVPSDLRVLGDRITHSSEHRTFKGFSGRRVVVIGAGSSAVEVTAGLVDAGADVHVLARRVQIPFWGAPDPSARPRSLWQRLRQPSSGLGPGMRNWLCQTFPDLFRRLPSDYRLGVVRDHLGPVSPWWLRDKVLGLADVRTQTTVRDVRLADGVVAVTTVDAHGASAELLVDHVISCTGYNADIDRLTFIDPALRDSIERVGSMPELSHHFESSVAGLYFVGAAAAGTFGPLMRFVVGTEFASPRVATHLASRARRGTAAVAA